MQNTTATAARTATAGTATALAWAHSLIIAGKIRCPQERNAELCVIWIGNDIIIEYW
jgi:hypothetical protein